MDSERLHPGDSTAFGGTVAYRLGKIASVTPIAGRWLDCGCAEGDYTAALVRSGARAAVGVDVVADRIDEARQRWGHEPRITFALAEAEQLPFAAESFDAVLLNEVLEHVRDDAQTLREAHRLLVPGGHLFVFSPNRWFPFEGHGAVIAGVRLRFPVPLLPWLPGRLTNRALLARNWWPRQLRDLVAAAGFEIVAVDFALPMFARYRWMPAPLIRQYERRFRAIESRRLVRRFGVSTLVVGRRARA